MPRSHGITTRRSGGCACDRSTCGRRSGDRSGERACGRPPLPRFAAMPVAIVARRLTTTNARIARAGGRAWRLLTPEASVGAAGVQATSRSAVSTCDPRSTASTAASRPSASSRREACACSIRPARCSRRTTSCSPPGCSRARASRIRRPWSRRGRTSRACVTRQSSSPASAAGGETSSGATTAALYEQLGALRDKTWFDEQGALVQELVAPRGLRLCAVVAGGRVVGRVGASRLPASGARTSPSGGRRERVDPPAGRAWPSALAAAGRGRRPRRRRPAPPGDGWTILELNGAVEFTPTTRSGATSSRRSRTSSRAPPSEAGGDRARGGADAG